MLIVRKSVLSPPLLKTKDASLIEFYDEISGELTGLLVKYVNNIWGMVMRSDPDWEATLVRLGYKTLSMSPRQFMESIKS